LDQPMKDLTSLLTGVFGFRLTLLRGVKTFNPLELGNPTQNKATTYTSYINIPASSPEVVESRRADGQNILTTDLVVKIPAKDCPVEPSALTDRILIGTQNRKVVQVNPVYVGKLITAYELIIRD
jgi:hypothetical protein